MAVTRVRRGEPVVVFASQARAADATSDEFKIGGGPVQGLELIIDVTAVSATPSVVFTIQGYDPTSGKPWTILASAAVTATTPTNPTVLRVHPELTASANAIAKDMIPNYFRVFADHADSDSITYSVVAHLI